MDCLNLSAFAAPVNAIKVRPTLAKEIVLTASDFNSMIDASKGNEAQFKINTPNPNGTISPNVFANKFEAIDAASQAVIPVPQAQHLVLKSGTAGYLMVDTARYREGDTKPSESPYLKMDVKPYTAVTGATGNIMNGNILAGRYQFKITYFASQDSLLIEPANYAMQSDADYQAKKMWKESNLQPLYLDPTNGSVAVNLAYLNDKYELTLVTPDRGAYKARISFDNVYDQLVRATKPTSLCFIQLVTTKTATTVHNYKRANNSYIVMDMGGHIVYDEKEASQDFNHMPATQWIVEQIGCTSTVPTVNQNPLVRITNREYKNVAFEGQLYKDKDGNFFIINHQDYKDSYLINNGSENTLSCMDTIKFSPVTPVGEGYLNLDKADLKEHVYTFNQFYDYGTNPNFLNVKDNKADTLLRVQPEATEFELTITKIDEYGASLKGVADKLHRATYRIKVKDANKVDNDRKWIAVDQNFKYVVATEATIAANPTTLRYANFYLKENNTYNGVCYYALVDVVTNQDGDWKLAVENGQLDTKLESLCENRTEAFAVKPVNRPLYRTIASNDTINIFDAVTKERLYEDAGSPYSKGLGINFLGAEYTGAVAEAPSMYVDYVAKSRAVMPQYLFVVSPDSVPEYTWCINGTHKEPNPGCNHEYKVDGYVAGRFMVNLNDSVDNALTNRHTNADVFKYQDYTRLAFVEGVHQKDTLFIIKDGYCLTERDAKTTGKTCITVSKDGHKYIPMNYFQDANVMTKHILDGKHCNYAFSLRLIDDDDVQNFLIESNDAVTGQVGKSAYGSFEGAWVKIHNHVPVLAKTNSENGNHETTGTIEELLTQANAFNLTNDENEVSDPTANGDITTSAVTVIAGNGDITIKGAANKTVTISNVLGQTIASTVLSSDEATISAPAGIVVVAVEGEAAVKAIVK